MFKAKIKSDIMRDFIDVIAVLVGEAKFNISSEGIKVRVVDISHVAMADVALKAGAFDELKAGQCELGIDIEKLSDALKLAKAGDVISLFHDEEKNKLVIGIENLTRRMALIDTTGMTEPKVPALNLPAKVKIRASELRQGIRAAEPISEHITFIATPDGFELSSVGDTDSVNLILKKDLLLGFECKETVKSLFSVSYLSNMVKSTCGAEAVTMQFGTEYPVMLEFDFANGEGTVKYLLAPRIESE
ncbi:MAG: proliferating cell nuclear antigen (pcna) [Candidatus Thermoplasmatota archaeon]